MKYKIPLFKSKSDNPRIPAYSLSMQSDDGRWFSVASIYKNVSKAGNPYLTLTLDSELAEKYMQQQNEKMLNYSEGSSSHGKKILLKNEPKTPKQQEVVAIDPLDLPF